MCVLRKPAVIIFSFICFVYLISCQSVQKKSGVFNGGHEAEAPYSVKPPVIDGNLEEWQNFIGTAVTVKDDLEVGKITDNGYDLEAVFYFSWDKEYLYFAAKVNDNEIIRIKEKSGIWKDDCIELFIDPKYNGLAWGDPEDFQIGLAPTDGGKKGEAWAWFQKKDPGENIKMVSSKYKDGYIIEAAIKWEFLNFKPEKGIHLGVSPAFHDKDNDETPDGKLNWHYSQDMLWGGNKLGKLILVKKQGERKEKQVVIKKKTGSLSPQEYYETTAKESPECYPRWLSKKQAYWTYTGVDYDDKEVLICEDGTLEPHKRGFTIMPFVYMDNKLITRDDVKVTQLLEKDYLPIPSVKWDYEDLVLNVKSFAYGKKGSSSAYTWYTIKNNSKKDISGKLFLVIHPFQVFPPWQGGGGKSPIHNIKYKNKVVQINKEYKIFLLSSPDNFGVRNGIFKSGNHPVGDIISEIKKGDVPLEKNTDEPNGFASGAVEYGFQLKSGEQRDVFILIPLYNKKPDLNVNIKESLVKNEFEKRIKKITAFWESKINKIEIDIPEMDIVNTLKANVLYNLITKDGYGFQPGSRAYDKVWMRDGGIAANSLLEMGFTKEIKEFIEWYSKFQFETGEIPPIIDTKAKDPLWEEKEQGLIEYDSQGEFIWTILQYYKYTKDKKFLRSQFPYVLKALKFLESLRKQRLTKEYKEGPPDKRRYYGILPPSTSHEGYAHAHSYWDDFWGLKGWKDGRRIAEILGKKKYIKWMDAEYNDFKKNFYNSMQIVMDIKKIDYISGCAELGDFDPTSTSIGIIYCDELNNLPQSALANTYDKYYKDIKMRLKKGAKYRFTPYEARSIPAYIYLGQKKRALVLLRFLLKCRKPLLWNHFAETVDSDHRFAGYFGDMPHTWVGAEYINAVRSLFVYEKDRKLILGAGIDEIWLDREDGVSVKNLPTYFGKLDYSIKKMDDVLKIKISGTAKPDNGFIFKFPFQDEEIERVMINNKKWRNFTETDIVFKKLPAEIIIEY